MLLIKRLKDDDGFTDIEKDIANYVIAYPREVMSMSIDRFANATYTSPSTIMRCCKKWRFKGFSDFKIQIASELKYFDMSEERVEVDMPIMAGSSDDEIITSFYNLSIQTMAQTHDNIDRKSMKEAALLLAEADSIMILGVGPSLLIGADLHYKLKRIGYDTTIEPLVGYERVFKKRKQCNQVAFIVSSYANSHQIKKWMSELTLLGIKIILVTGNSKSPFISVANITVLMDLNEKRNGKMGSFASRISLTYAVDCIYALLFNLNHEENVKLLYEESLRVNHQGYLVDPESGNVLS